MEHASKITQVALRIFHKLYAKYVLLPFFCKTESVKEYSIVRDSIRAAMNVRKDLY